MAKGIDIKVDFNQMYELIGAGFAISKIGTGSDYFNDLIKAGYAYAEKDFNREVVAFAKSTGGLGHMFEWGTIGINNKRSTTRPDPMSERARLWESHFIYYRGSGKITYSYKQSVGVVPKPTVAETGIPSKILNRLKDHIFFNKAMVLEEGLPVTIKPKADNKRQLLFVPNLWKGEKGYTMYNRPTNPDVSQDTKGTFNIFFDSWWERMGAPAINEDVIKWFKIDLQNTIDSIERSNTRHPTKPVRNDKGLIDRAEKTVVKYLKEAAQKRIMQSED